MTYKKALKKAVPKVYRDKFFGYHYLGGIYGCPRNQFTDAKCVCEDCITCWNQPYKGEILKGSDKRRQYLKICMLDKPISE